MNRLALLFIIFCYTSCHNTVKENQQINKGKNVDSIQMQTSFQSRIHETRLGESNYYIQLPGEFEISEAEGKEGQLGYCIIPKDTTSTMFGFIEIKAGNPIDPISTSEVSPEQIVSSYFLGKQVQWKIYVSARGYYNAATYEKGDLNANASSKMRTEIDSLIFIISTITRK